MTEPDAPVNLNNVAETTSGTQIGLVWEEGAANGGSPVIDYRLYFDYGSGSFVILASNVVGTSFTATGLTADTTYKFKV